MYNHSTGRSLELTIEALRERAEGTGGTLEDYLRAVWTLARPLRDHAALSVDTFLHLLEAALTAPVPPFDDSWRRLPTITGDERPGFAGWESQILRQIRDLREMEEAGAMRDPERWFGMDAPSGSRWYNYAVPDYLGGAVAGTFGGWQPEDGRRMVVPGPVAVMGQDGQITDVDPSQIEPPRHEIPGVTWDLFTSFLRCGQWYE